MGSDNRSNMRQAANRRYAVGSGLLEVLVLIVVMAVGMLAMAKMHTILMRDGGTANNRAIAISLAQEKIDDLRGFSYLDTTSASANGADCGDSTFCYDEITTAGNTGGNQSGGVLNVPAGNITVGNTTFTRSWTTSALTSTGATAANEATTAYKLVTVTVTWNDQNYRDPANPASVSLQTAIIREDPMVTAFSATGAPPGGSGYGPKVEYNKGLAPDVVSVPIEQGNVSKETSKPLPDVVSAGSSVATSFQSVTYTEGSPNIKQKLDDFLTVSCVCKFDNPVSGDGYPASYYYWDTNSQVLKVKYPSDYVTKNRGVVNSNGQHWLCGDCCRDHHDSSSTSTAQYDTERPTTAPSDFNSGDHNHYYYVNASNPQNGLQVVTPAANQAYLEACRFLRVDGYYRLMQDWIAKDLTVLPKTNYLTDATTLGTYQTYVTNVIKHYADVDCTAAGASGCVSATMPSKSTLPNRNLSNALSASQLLSRAIYMDRVYGKNAPRTLDSTYYSKLAQKIAANSDWLDIVPFNEVNTTLLTSWYSSNASNVSVTNGTIADITASAVDYYGVYSRGVATAISGNADIYAVLLASNSGLTGGAKQGTYSGSQDYPDGASIPYSNPSGDTVPYSSEIGIDQDDHSTATRLSNFINVSKGASNGISGLVSMGNASANLNAVTVNDGLSNCTLSGQGTSWAFTCQATTGTLTITSADASAFFAHGMDTTYDTEGVLTPPATYTVASPGGPGSGGTFWVFGPTAEVRGTISCTPAAACSEVNVKTSDNVSCTISNGVVACPVTLSSNVWSGTVTLANNAGKNNDLGVALGTSGCTATNSTAKTTGTISDGPADMPSAMNLCVVAGAALAPCTLGTTTVQSGETLTAYTATSVTWPSMCSAISQSRLCTNGTLSGSYAYDTCGQVQVAPAISWTGASNPKTVTWAAIAGASQYKVYTCTQTSASGPPSSHCVPSSPATVTQAGTTYAPTPASKDEICVRVAATTGTSDSLMSNTLCIYQKNGAYTYSSP